MNAGRIFAMVTGIFFLSAGLMGFLPGFVAPSDIVPEVATRIGADAGYGYLLGIFPINGLHNVVHLLVGIAGIGSAIALDSSRSYARGLAVLYGLLAILGLIPYANTTFGLIPIFGHDVWLHGVTAALATYFGFFASPGLLEISSREPSTDL
ncbi:MULTISPECIES: DUF4383 domain-containing protein [unclassified Leptolyngbya]|uniref:DUF4383 domain-containing protein n=1 Tax=unclassified Leptolyngbya TaxID=2650499 RepID=UPI001689546E|nr:MULTISPECIES: DUF4383 domain-containing protein [unclassified Leptolyngbya]MBD1908997.1 DUF4383 domain-containing protein [Leptolyngbya sp. FACHB-8]MBD2158103.1 DUF4383 domain-containing protein [Leptolyngbya sp. FACHB-16]